MAHWQDLWLGNMTPAQMRKFIICQNTYDYDGRSIWHSKEALAKFCDLPDTHPKYQTFVRVYDKVTKEFKTKIDF